MRGGQITRNQRNRQEGKGDDAGGAKSEPGMAKKYEGGGDRRRDRDQSESKRNGIGKEAARPAPVACDLPDNQRAQTEISENLKITHQDDRNGVLADAAWTKHP